MKFSLSLSLPSLSLFFVIIKQYTNVAFAVNDNEPKWYEGRKYHVERGRRLMLTHKYTHKRRNRTKVNKMKWNWNNIFFFTYGLQAFNCVGDKRWRQSRIFLSKHYHDRVVWRIYWVTATAIIKKEV